MLPGERHELVNLDPAQAVEISIVPTSLDIAVQTVSGMADEVSIRILKGKFDFEGITRQR